MFIDAKLAPREVLGVFAKLSLTHFWDHVQSWGLGKRLDSLNKKN
jgi:hypothetical protein